MWIRLRAKRAGVDWHLDREGGAHEIWKLDGKLIVIPRHNEIVIHTAKSIMKRVSEVLAGE